MLDQIRPGLEYASLLDVQPENLNARDELRRAIAKVEEIRGRPLLLYVANVLKPSSEVRASIDLTDDLPFAELVAAVPAEATAVDVLLVTPGGVAQQVAQFVQRLRPRFADVTFILPHMCMSAGTIWALSGNDIIMDERAFLGPIDPQVPSRDGQLVPAQTVLTLIKRIQEEGDKRIAAGLSPAWSDIQILRNMDPKEIGNALAMSKYSVQLAAEYLERHKFRDWPAHRDGRPVTDADRRDRAVEVAEKLCSHDTWKVHSHGIFRDVAWNEVRIKITALEESPNLQDAVRALWALLYWLFENTILIKIFLSQNYALFRNRPKANA